MNKADVQQAMLETLITSGITMVVVTTKDKQEHSIRKITGTAGATFYHTTQRGCVLVASELESVFFVEMGVRL